MLTGLTKDASCAAVDAPCVPLLAGAASSDTTVRVWDAAEGSCVQELKGHQRAVTAVALSDSA